MPRLRHTVEQILAKLREAEVALSKGQAAARVPPPENVRQMNKELELFAPASGLKRYSDPGRLSVFSALTK